jgi:ABC-type dipeptide/oligopeptide/nickel transport system permease subunit
MSLERRVPFRLIRLKNFLLVLLKNRLAFAGLALLLLFVFAAVAAPVLTSNYPTEKVGGILAPPSWSSYFSGIGHSQNAQFSGLTVYTNTSSLGVSLQSTPQGPDVVNVTVSSASGGTILVVKTMDYPYSAPPAEFDGTVTITPSNFTSSQPPRLAVFFEKVNVSQWGPLWNATLKPGVQSYTTLRSTDPGLASSLGYTRGTDLGRIVFSAKGTYRYFLMITLPQGQFQSSFLIKQFSMTLLGDSYGLMGTDATGGDIFSQFVYGARLSLMVGLFATAIGIGVGLMIGLMAGFLGKMIDEILMRFTDMMLVIPSLPLLIVLATVLGTSLYNIILILGFLGWMGFARLVRSQVLSLRERPFIEAARASGAGTGYILARHIFPNIVSLTYVNLALSVPAAIVGEAALSFLGLGDQTAITWGKMLEAAHEGTTSLAWWWVIPPGLGIALLSLSFILIGYSLDELFNPRLRRRR